MKPLFKFKDRVRVIDPKYCCAKLGALGTIVETGEPLGNGEYRYLIRFDYSPTTLFGVHQSSVEKE